MILNTTDQNSVLGIDQDCTLKMTIDDSDIGVLMMILSQGLYSNPIGSLIRETVTNALDSMVEIGSKNPIIARLEKKNEQYVFSVEDSGVGLSPERVENIFSKYCASTKRNSITQIGAFGLGSKSPLSYTDSFTIISRYNGKIYNYMMLKGIEGTELSLIDLDDTDLPNGVTIKVNLKDPNDYELFVRNIQQQLAYFEQVHIITDYGEIDPEFKIIKNEDWKYSEINNDSYIHLCLQDIYYPIDFKQLGIDPIKIPIGLNFSLSDNITPTPNREGFMYTANTKELIINRIKKIGINFINQWNILIPFIDRIEEAEVYKKEFGKIILFENENKKIEVKIDKNIESICNLKMLHVKLSLFPNLPVQVLIDQRNNILQEYDIHSKFDFGKINKMKHGVASFYTYMLRDSHKIAILLKEGESLSKLQSDYLSWLSGKENSIIYIVRKNHNIKLGRYQKYGYSSDSYRGILGLDKYPKNKWREIITEFQYYIKSFSDTFVLYDSIVPSLEFFKWKEDNKIQRKKAYYNLKEEITYGKVRHTERGVNKFTKDKITKKIIELKKESSIVIYTSEDRINEFDELFKFKNHIKYVVFSNRNSIKLQNYLKEHTLKNWISLDDIWSNKIKPISKIITRLLVVEINNLIQKDFHKQISLDKSVLFNILKKQTNDYKERAYTVSKYIANNNFYLAPKLFKDILLLYSTNKWLDYEKIEDFKSVIKDIDKYTFLECFNTQTWDCKNTKKAALYLYIQQKKNEKINGIQYKQYDVQKMIDDFLKPEPELKEAIPIEDPLDDYNQELKEEEEEEESSITGNPQWDLADEIERVNTLNEYILSLDNGPVEKEEKVLEYYF